jgi:hypothetical protein
VDADLMGAPGLEPHPEQPERCGPS